MSNRLNFNKLEALRVERGIGLEDFAQSLGFKSRHGYKKAVANQTVGLRLFPVIAEKLKIDMYDLMRELDVTHSLVEEERVEYVKSKSLEDCENRFKFLELMFQKRGDLEKLLRESDTE